MCIVPINATDVRKERGSVLDGYQFAAECFREDDSSITMVLNEIDLVENSATEQEARKQLAQSVIDYLIEFYENYALYSHVPNRKKRIPYVFKALIVEDISELEGKIICPVERTEEVLTLQN